LFLKIHIILLLFVSFVFADSASEIIEKIQEKYEELKNLSAEFVQTDQFRLTGAKNETVGRIFIKNGVQYRLETEDQIIVTDGKSVWNYSVFNNQVLIDRVKEGDGSLLPRDLIYKYPREYYATLLKKENIDGEDYYLIKLDPKEDVHGFIRTMKILVNTESYIISKIEYTDFNENVSSFEIKKVDGETSLPESLFKYEIKEGTEVVDLR